jgi:uncharacterized protein
MVQSHWEEILLKEHRHIAQALEELEIHGAMSDRERTRLQKTLSFLLDFGDRIHNVKEENHLFPLLVDHGVPQEGLIIKMLLEHEGAREHLAHILTRLSAEDLTEEEAKRIGKTLSEYRQKRNNHIKVEEEDLFPLARSIVLPEDEGKLLFAFSKVDEKNGREKALSAYAEPNLT